MVRRHTPKGSDLDQISRNRIRKIEKWINTYPREIFGWKNSEELFQKEVENCLDDKKVCNWA